MVVVVVGGKQEPQIQLPSLYNHLNWRHTLRMEGNSNCEIEREQVSDYYYGHYLSMITVIIRL